MNNFAFGFRVVGSPLNDRRLIDWQRAFDAHCRADERAETSRESYLSLFTFGDEFREHLESTGSTKGYRGPCWSAWLWFDIDRENDIDAATADARRLTAFLAERYGIDHELLSFFSGSKGFHVGLPTSLFEPKPSATFHRITRRFAETVAALIGIEIDSGIYDRVRLFRSPNSRHPKAGLFKRHLSLDELLQLKPSAIVAMAETPEPFDPPALPPLNPTAVNDWRQAAEAVEQESQKQPKGTAEAARLNRSTMAFIRDGATKGDRHRLLFSAAANLAELGCPSGLAHKLLTDAAFDSGLSPSDARRQIGCGLSHVRGTAPDAAQETPDDESAEDNTGTVTNDSRPTDGTPPTLEELTKLWEPK